MFYTVLFVINQKKTMIYNFLSKLSSILENLRIFPKLIRHLPKVKKIYNLQVRIKMLNNFFSHFRLRGQFWSIFRTQIKIYCDFSQVLTFGSKFPATLEKSQFKSGQLMSINLYILKRGCMFFIT